MEKFIKQCRQICTRYGQLKQVGLHYEYKVLYAKCSKAIKIYNETPNGQKRTRYKVQISEFNKSIRALKKINLETDIVDEKIYHDFKTLKRRLADEEYDFYPAFEEENYQLYLNFEQNLLNLGTRLVEEYTAFKEIETELLGETKESWDNYDALISLKERMVRTTFVKNIQLMLSDLMKWIQVGKVLQDNVASVEKQYEELEKLYSKEVMEIDLPDTDREVDSKQMTNSFKQIKFSELNDACEKSKKYSFAEGMPEKTEKMEEWLIHNSPAKHILKKG